MSMLRAMQRNRLKIDLTVARRGAAAIALCALTACATRFDQAPVVDRTAPFGAAAAQPAAPLGPPPPGYYRVKPGDTLYRIALENGQNYRDIAAWNNLTNPNQIEVDQLLRVVPPGAGATAMTPGVVTAPVPAGSVQNVPPVYGAGANAAPTPSAPMGGANDTAMPSAGIALGWPVRGPLLNGFDDAKNKGINIGGASGDAVKAAADGRVVYAGNGLRGYGNLIIIKHDATFLTAYAHNRALMVKEGDAVTKGQKIAEMGNSDSDRVMLHFEVRRQGKPVDPLKYLPPQ
ncbi:MAG: LysM peptidoglycan-binding domain-containing protein [Paraburkholderia sp.]|uniref:peptidoglycan DD-metalloendopeptidase family protein n=1 Tax=Paraburkholderia sp. TaxID=1926495 RepID=UPI0011FF9F89|nr:peptidoglycan DD-metalloendopeptidase family protein [Paraburkholderia sp.]TAM03680.1 MAG: LysM peptidoglycan-binding domain-containing protein [Paraburkholderia sp.]TAM31200.1 MAG: LysM peptidoglycan-binding domain-containing protein [Paraburkholderia sp.]